MNKIRDTYCHLPETQNYFYIVFPIMYYSYWLRQHKVRALWSGIEFALQHTEYWSYCSNRDALCHFLWDEDKLISPGVIKTIRLRSLNAFYLFLFAATATHTPAWQPVNSGPWERTSLCTDGHRPLDSSTDLNIKNTLRLMLNNFINCFYGF